MSSKIYGILGDIHANTEALKAVLIRLAPDQPHRGAERPHGSFFQFYAPNRGRIGAAPEEIEPPVLILK
jgi:hypothetical protein